MVYDKKDRLVLSQDGNQRNTNSWMYSKYDTFNRVVGTGICKSTKEIQAIRKLAEVDYIAEKDLLRSNKTLINGIGYLSKVEVTVLTETYYGNYDFARVTSPGLYSEKSCAIGISDKVKGLVTGTKLRVLRISEEKYIVTTNHYDSKYRLVQSIKNLYPSGTSVISSRYDFIRNVTHTKEWQSHGGSIDVDNA